MRRNRPMSGPAYEPKQVELNFDLWAKQLEAFESPAQELFYGGAAGGGKSHLERVASIVWCLDVPGLQYYLFRRQFSDLVKSYIEGPTGYLELLGPLMDEGGAEHVAKEIRFPNGSKIYLCHCQHEKDVTSFGSFEFHVLNIAEAGEFSEFMINYLRSRVRMPEQFKERMPEKYVVPRQWWREEGVPEWVFPRAFYTANPIGPGKAFLKRNFVSGHKAGELWRAAEHEGGMLRQFIPAKLKDNPSLNFNSYKAALTGIGNQAYVDALLDGSWEATVGAFFPQINRVKHVLQPFVIPEHWPRFMAMDWGACGDGDPFSIGWYAISDGSVIGKSFYDSGVTTSIPRDAMICYRRWNGAGMAKCTALEVANGIHQRERGGELMLYRVAGGDIIEQRGHGESIFRIFKNEGLSFVRADMRRKNGWAQVDYRLSGRNGIPLSYWFPDCEEDLETMSNLQHDMHDPQDLRGKDDHDADRHRYAAMQRPIAMDAPPEATPQPRGYSDSPREILKHFATKRKRR